MLLEYIRLAHPTHLFHQTQPTQQTQLPHLTHQIALLIAFMTWLLRHT